MTVSGTQLSLQPNPDGGGEPAAWNPADNGLLAWSVDPGVHASSGSAAWAAGFLQLVAGKMNKTAPIKKIGLSLRSTAAASLTHTYLGIYTVSGSTGTLVGSTANLSSTMNGVASPTLFDLAAQTPVLPAGTKFFFALYFASSSAGPSATGLGAARANAFISSLSNYRTLAKSTPGLTELPATVDLTTFVDPGVVICVVAA